jgi:hypothetical protein
MTLHVLGRLAGAAALTLALAGCIDVSMDVEVTSETTAKGTMTQVMSAQVYPMIKASAEEGGDTSTEGFCDKGELTENADGSATCVITEEGAFADLTFDQKEGEESVTFTSVGPGLVRIAFNTKDMAGDVTEGGGEDMDAEAKAMMEAYFVGHFLTLSVKGGEITDTNMTLAEDKMSAETKIEFVALLNGEADLPDELYAIVRK